MNFPLILEIATQEVIKIKINDTLEHAVDLLFKFKHRNLVVTDNDKFYILTSNAILKLKLQDYDFNSTLETLNLNELASINKNSNVLDTMAFVKDNIEYICVTNDDNSLFGLLTYTDIISYIDPEALMENYRLSDLINLTRNIKTVCKDDLAVDVLESIAYSNLDCAIITQDEKAIGIVTTKDIMSFLKNDFNNSFKIKDIMSSPVITLNDNASVKESIKFMKEKHFKRIVIASEEGKLIGLILQKELISLSYSKWAIIMKEYSTQLSQINNMLERDNSKFEKMAFTDQLTGLYNRYKFTEIFVSEYKTMTQRDNSMSLIMIDIDFFKKINDTYGHNMGDAVLLQLSNILLRYLRNVDVISRWGGEEFLILLPTATIENAYKLGEKIRIAIQDFDMDESLKITVSIGITEVKIGDDIKDSVKRADTALYEAKDSGRNCVKIN